MQAEQAYPRTLIGAGISRVDGDRKVTGSALYAAEMWFPGLAHAVVVQSPIARGRIVEIDMSAALSAPGVLDIITWQNAPKLHPFESNAQNRPGQTYLVLQDDLVRYYGQHLAIVIAETFEQAQYASSLIRIAYLVEPSNTDLTKVLETAFKPGRTTVIDPPDVDSERGDAAGQYPRSRIKLNLTYTTPIENHNAMEPHATVAHWSGEDLLLCDSTQWVFGARRMVAAHLGIEPNCIRIVSPFVGGGFGSKGNPWPHPTLAAIAARHVNRPVKLVLARRQMFSQVGHRPATFQRMQIGASSDGRLISIAHNVFSGTSQFDDFVESSGATTRVSYSCPNVVTTHRIARLDVNTPCPMRAPGEGTGSFVVESAIDELAYAANLDPLEVRLRNYAEKDEDRDKPFSSKSLRECYALAAERFGWSQRPPQPRSMVRGDVLVGLGMASAIFFAKLSPASARVQLDADGIVHVRSSTHDIGTGAYTSLGQVAAQALQVSLSAVRVELADTNLPEAPASAGSQTSGSVGSAVLLAARQARAKLIEVATTYSGSPFYGLAASDVLLSGAFLVSTQYPQRRLNWAELIANACPDDHMIEAEAKWTPPPIKERIWSGWSFGAHFCETEVDEDLGQARIVRWVSAFAAGKILNEKTARSQLIGGIVWGIGQALLEETVHDDYAGSIVNANLADYLVPVHADIPFIDVLLIGESDHLVNPLGAKGLGELGICGAAAAIANSIYHATGRRFRRLPIKVNDFLS